jgi:putative transposase
LWSRCSQRRQVQKSFVHFQPPDLKLTYQVVAVLETDFKIETLCRVLQVSRSGYYRYRKGESYQASESKKKQAKEVKRVFDEHKRRYGSRRILAELKDLHLQVGRHRVRVLMQESCLKAIQPKRFVPKTTDSSHGKKACANLLLNEQGNFIGLPTAPDRMWVSDITHIPLVSGKFIYLGTWLDLFSRMIVGWQIEDNMQEMLLIKALDKALQNRRPVPGLIVHSDRGGQYFSKKMRKLLKKHHCLQSMSRRDEVYDNSYAESFFSRFKAELMEDGAFMSLEDAKTEIFEFIEIYYNRKRRHSALGYKSPLAYERAYYRTLGK